MDKKYILVARDQYNKSSIIEIKSNISKQFEKMNSLLEIDKMTTKYFDSIDDFKKRVQNGKYEHCDIYIVHKKRNNGEDLLNFRDVIFQSSGANINHFLNCADEKGKISLSDSYLTKYLGELIYRLKIEPQYKGYMDKIFPHLRDYFNLAISNKLTLVSNEYLKFLKKISNYLEIRKLIMATNQYDGKIQNFYQDRIEAEYPLYVLVSDHLVEYQRNDLEKKITLKEFQNLKPAMKKNNENYVSGQIELLLETTDDDLEFITEEEKLQMTGIDENNYENELYRARK